MLIEKETSTLTLKEQKIRKRREWIYRHLLQEGGGGEQVRKKGSFSNLRRKRRNEALKKSSRRIIGQRKKERTHQMMATKKKSAEARAKLLKLKEGPGMNEKGGGEKIPTLHKKEEG